MSVQKNRQAAGTWTVSLKPHTPRAITDLLVIDSTVGAFGHIVITAGHVDPNAIGTSDLLGLSIYTGVYRSQKDRYTLSGAHATIWLGDEDGKADLQETSTGSVSKTFANWVAAILPAQLTTGTVTNTGSAKTYLYYWVNQDSSPRQALNTVCDMYGAEWEVTDQLTLNAAVPTTLYGSTPTVICTPWFQGRDDTYKALRARMGYTVDVEDYATRVLVLFNSGASGSGSTGTTSYKDGQGNALVWKRKVEAPDVTDATAADAIAAQQKTQWNQTRQAVTIATDSPAVMRDVRCGTYIYAYNPDVDLYDFNNAVTYQGQVIYPVKLRVEAVTMPITSDLGVYFLPGDGTVVDLNEWVAYESPGSTIAVGAPVRRLAPSVKERGTRTK